MTTPKLQGILPAVITPLDSTGRFELHAFEVLIERLYSCGTNGLYLCGQAGEGLSQPLSQRKKVVEAAARLSPPDKLLIVQVGAALTSEAIELAEHAANTGVQAIASLPPIGEFAFSEIVLYYQALAAASSLPLFVYHHPGLCPMMTPDMALELCSIPNVVGLKFTDFDLFGLSDIRHRGHIVFNGRDEVLVAGLLLGANGGIGAFYNVVPRAIVSIYEFARNGQWAEAAKVQLFLNQLFKELSRFPLVPAIRAILSLSGIDCGESLSPRRKLTAAELNEVREIYNRSQLLNSQASPSGSISGAKTEAEGVSTPESGL